MANLEKSPSRPFDYTAAEGEASCIFNELEWSSPEKKERATTLFNQLDWGIFESESADELLVLLRKEGNSIVLLGRGIPPNAMNFFAVARLLKSFEKRRENGFETRSTLFSELFNPRLNDENGRGSLTSALVKQVDFTVRKTETITRTLGVRLGFHLASDKKKVPQDLIGTTRLIDFEQGSTFKPVLLGRIIRREINIGKRINAMKSSLETAAQQRNFAATENFSAVVVAAFRGTKAPQANRIYFTPDFHQEDSLVVVDVTTEEIAAQIHKSIKPLFDLVLKPLKSPTPQSGGKNKSNR